MNNYSYYVGDDPNWFYRPTTTQVSPPRFVGWGRQGWICPKCGSVYSPDTPMCYKCNGNNQIMPATTTTKYLPDGAITHIVKEPWNEPQIKLTPEQIAEKMFYVDYDNLPYY